MAKAKKKMKKKAAKKKAVKKTATRKVAVKAMKKVKKILKTAKPRSILNFKISGKDRVGLSALAKKYAQGNISAWLRHAGLRYQPKRGEKIALPYNYRPA